MKMKLSMETMLLFSILAIHNIQTVHTATIARLDDIQKSIEKVQQKYSDNNDNNNNINNKIDERIDNKNSIQNDNKNNKLDTQSTKSKSIDIPTDNLNDASSNRHNKMLEYFNYFPQLMTAQYPQQNLYQSNFYGDDFIDYEEDDSMSRGNRRRPASNQNSPIYYIRLPPTPYMFVPGMGYISQPPTIQPLASPFPMPHPIRQVPINPFINLPINFITNGKPTNIYQWSAPPPPPQMPQPQQQIDNNFGPQYPSYLPTRPNRPTYRPKPYLQDSKITHLKGPFVFNGRPEEVFVLQNSSPYSQQYTPNFHNSPYSGGSYSSSPFGSAAFGQPAYNTPYNAPFNSVYTNPLPNYY